MARMLGRVNQPWCPVCNAPPGPDCPVVGDRGKRQQRRTENTDVRAQVSRLWAQDWDNPDDAVYDES